MDGIIERIVRHDRTTAGCGRELRALLDEFEAAVRKDEITRVMDSDTASANMGRTA